MPAVGLWSIRHGRVKRISSFNSCFLKAFTAQGVNAYNIRKGGFTRDGGVRQCIAVRYNIDCGENTTAVCNRSSCGNQKSATAGTEETESYAAAADEHITLWTTFNGSSTTGNTLLKLSVFDLRVFGFELCDVYIEPIHFNITLDSDEPIPQSCYDIRTALIDFTTWVS